jgi:hypothetical protein
MKLYPSHSEDQFLVKYERGSLEIAAAASGICLGQSLSWCMNMLQDVPAINTQPSYGAAAAAATKYLWGLKRGLTDDQSIADVCRTMSMVAHGVTKGNGYTHYWRITHSPGVYLLMIEGHAMAAAIRDGKYYLFDPSDGLYEFDSALGLNHKMLEYQKYVASRQVTLS